MRLISACGLFQAFIKVEDSEQPVYQQKRIEGNDPRMHGHVVSKVGKSYATHVNMARHLNSNEQVLAQTAGYPDLKVTLHIDGVLVNSYGVIGGSRTSVCFEEVRTSLGQSRKLIFSQPDLTADSQELDAEAAREIGTIRIDIKRVRLGQLRKEVDNPFNASPIAKVGEQSKKLLSAVTTYGEALDAPPTGTYSSCDIHPSDANARVFRKLVLQYATEDILLARGIVRWCDLNGADDDASVLTELSDEEEAPIDVDAIAVKVENSEGDNDIDEDSVGDEDEEAIIEEEHIMLAKLQAIQAKKTATQEAKKRKRGEGVDEEDDKAAVMRKAEMRMRKKLQEAKKVDGGEIDLTGDDD